ncbi:flavin reductase family protein [Lipingzhangella sp. LS1_29]|uniref:Flavin reductase family protein n=1 Tax=Lipingzhangella rawalii TaxID=2055835 RepID=A0ABU2H0Q7_9ACTN|nr:flavin reductase family protein [Lipingzhangella rawalii]MDS1268893.1 flavin reductase family protein [Lipingzhangella rawalii]
MSARPSMESVETTAEPNGQVDGASGQHVASVGPAVAPGDSIDPDTYRQAMATHAAGVVVVTAPSDRGPVGLTVTSFTSVSLRPPLVSFYVGARASAWPGIRDAGTFAVNVLGANQHEVATRFATSGVDRFAPPVSWHRSLEEIPLLDGAIAHILCHHHNVLAVGDHWLVVGRVTGAVSVEAGEPLLYQRGGYARLHPIIET